MGIGNSIKKYRNHAKMTQKQLADAVGVKHNTVSGWESDRTSPDTDAIILICDTLKISADMLLETEKTAQGEMTLNGFDHALLDMTKEYTQEQKAQFLENAKIFDSALKWKEQQGEG